MTPEKLREWLVGIEKDFAWSIGKRDMEALAQLRAMLDAQGKPSPCGDVRDCAECINLADCCPMADARGPGLGLNQVIGDDGELYTLGISGGPWVFDVAINALADFRIGLADDGPQKGWTAEINKAIAVLEAAGEVRFDDIGRADESDVIPLLKAIFEARRDR